MKYEIKNRWTGELIYSTEANSWIEVIKEARERARTCGARTCERGPVRREPVGREPVRREPVGRGPVRREPAARTCTARTCGARTCGARTCTARTCRARTCGARPAERGPVRREPAGADLSARTCAEREPRREPERGPVGRGPAEADASADLPSPTMVLLAIWGELSEQLTADLMLFDASAHPDQAAFQRWADGGPCPYEGIKVQRAANFKESKKLWGTGKPDTIYNLMVRVLKEKTKQ